MYVHDMYTTVALEVAHQSSYSPSPSLHRHSSSAYPLRRPPPSLRRHSSSAYPLRRPPPSLCRHSSITTPPSSMRRQSSSACRAAHAHHADHTLCYPMWNDLYTLWLLKRGVCKHACACMLTHAHEAVGEDLADLTGV